MTRTAADVESEKKEGLKAIGSVVITGGSSGIGKYFVHRIRMLESRPAICNLSRSKPEDFFHDCPFHHFTCDLANPQELELSATKLIATLENRPGKILLINNSGFGAYGSFPAPDIEHHLDMIDVNAKAPVHLTALLLPLIRKKGGAIMNIASTAAFLPTPYMATYGATKAFLLHWSLALSEELREFNIPVLAVCPGPTATRFFIRAGFNEPVVSDSIGLTVEEVVENALAALTRRKSVTVPGFLNKLLTAIAPKLPKPLMTRIAGKVLHRYRNEKNNIQ